MSAAILPHAMVNVTESCTSGPDKPITMLTTGILATMVTAAKIAKMYVLHKDWS